MLTRKLLWGLPAIAAVGAGILADRWLAREAAAEGKQDLKPAVALPISRVVLFNSGVGYFSRSGEVEGDARVDLAFQETDVNDLLKSMVLEVCITPFGSPVDPEVKTTRFSASASIGDAATGAGSEDGTTRGHGARSAPSPAQADT